MDIYVLQSIAVNEILTVRVVCELSLPTDAAYYNYSVCFRQSNVRQGSVYCNTTISAKLNSVGNLQSQDNIDLACR